MNDFDPNKMSRSARSKQQKVEPQFSRKSSQQNSEHKRSGILDYSWITDFIECPSLWLLGES